MTEIVKLNGSLDDALNNLAHYIHLNQIIDRAKFTEQVKKKYPDGPEIASDGFWDLYTALLSLNYSYCRQAGQNQATPEGVLNTLDQCAAYISNQRKKIALSNKLCNLRTTSLWDTLAELVLLRNFTEGMKDFSIEVDYQLSKRSRRHVSKDADLAVLDKNGTLIFLIDAYSPNNIHDSVISRIAKKYDDKFSEYCSKNKSVKVIIALSILKSETNYVSFLPQMMAGNGPPRLTDPTLTLRQGLDYAVICSFRSLDGKTLLLDKVAEYIRPESSNPQINQPNLAKPQQSD